MRFRDTKGCSLGPEMWGGPGSLMDHPGLREDLTEIAGVVERAFPGSDIPARTRALLARAATVREELLAEWSALAPTLEYVGWEVENGMPEDQIAARFHAWEQRRK